MKIILFDPAKAKVGETYQNRKGDRQFIYMGTYKTRAYFVDSTDGKPIWRSENGSFDSANPHDYDIVMEVPGEHRSGVDLFPPGTVISLRPGEGTWTKVMWVGKHEIAIGFNIHSYEALAQSDFKRSIDGGKTWLPCYVEA